MRPLPPTRSWSRPGPLAAGLLLLATALALLASGPPGDRRGDAQPTGRASMAALGALATLAAAEPGGRLALVREPVVPPPHLMLGLLAVLAVLAVASRLTARSPHAAPRRRRRTRLSGHVAGPPPDRGPPLLPAH